MRTLTYFVACTVDGFIARADGSFDGFLPAGEHLDDIVRNYPETIPAHAREMLGATGEATHFDAILMGRSTYEVGLKLGITSPYSHLRQYVFSRSLPPSTEPGIEFVSGDALSRVRALKQEPGLGIWLCGGGDLASQLLPEIDELILKVNPVLFGTGIPLFAGAFLQPLNLVASHAYGNGVVLQRYTLGRAEPSRDG